MWAVLEQYSGNYRVSDSGQVQSRHKKGCGKTFVDWWDMSIGLCPNGYRVVYFWHENKRVRRLVHQLVAEAFVFRPAGMDTVNHLNGVKTDNRHTNLEWTTRSDNLRHAWATGLCKAPKLNPQAVREIRAYPLNDTETARVFGISQVMVTKIRAFKAWRHVQ
jgi:hypothetical protein